MYIGLELSWLVILFARWFLYLSYTVLMKCCCSLLCFVSVCFVFVFCLFCFVFVVVVFVVVGGGGGFVCLFVFCTLQTSNLKTE